MLVNGAFYMERVEEDHKSKLSTPVVAAQAEYIAPPLAAALPSALRISPVALSTGKPHTNKESADRLGQRKRGQGPEEQEGRADARLLRVSGRLSDKPLRLAHDLIQQGGLLAALEDGRGRRVLGRGGVGLAAVVRVGGRVEAMVTFEGIGCEGVTLGRRGGIWEGVRAVGRRRGEEGGG